MSRQPGPELRKAIRARDADICQYCGQSVGATPHIDHVIPDVVSDCSEPYNLVLACRVCNFQKGKRTWIPRNLDAITQDQPAWRARVLDIARMPTIGFGERRLNGVGTTLNDSEWALYKQRLQASGLSQMEYVRRALFAYEADVTDPETNTQLAALATAEGTTPRYWLERTIRAAYAALQTSQGATQREGEQRTHGQ